MGDTPLARVEEWLRYARELQLDPFFVMRAERPATVGTGGDAARDVNIATQTSATNQNRPANTVANTDPVMKKASSIFAPASAPAPAAKKSALPPIIMPAAPELSLFESTTAVVNDSLEKIREDIGECTRCKLHKGRTKLVFGSGNAKAELVFIGEGPGRDEDIQGLPFVGRAGKLLTSMIEAMGLKREQVYICNVVKCRPPENRTPEKDETATCSPFLFRQLKVIAPKAIVCLGAVAAQALLATGQSVSKYRGEWLDFMGTKLMVTYHPAYLLRNPAAKGEVWKDLQKVMAELGLKKKMAAAR
jgi:uracil-DNA glycosylase